jgi:predicted AAA+ superfamily ATPase
MLPLSLKEFALAHPEINERQRLYAEYTSTSSFPYTVELSGAGREMDSYLEGIYNTILVKDVMTRRQIRDPMILGSVAKFVFSSIGSELSVKRIADTLTSGNRKTDSKTVEKYLSALMECFVIYQAERYDIKGKQLLKTQEKYYVVDIGLRRHVLGGHHQDAGHILENVVFLELLRRGGKVRVGKISGLEIDFVVEDANDTVYYQVAASVRDSSTLARELAPFYKIQDSHPKYLLTLDEDPSDNIDGIRKLNALEWLLQ